MCAEPVSKGDITLNLGLVNSDVFFTLHCAGFVKLPYLVLLLLNYY